MLPTTLRSLRPLPHHVRRPRYRPQPPCQPCSLSAAWWLARHHATRTVVADGARGESDGMGNLLVFGFLLATSSYTAFQRYEKCSPHSHQPKHLLNDSLKIVIQNEEVHRRLGSKLVGRGEQVGEWPVWEHIQHIKVWDKDGRPCLRIRYNLFGPRGYASVFAEAAEASEDGEFNFIFVQFNNTHEVVTVVDPVDGVNAWKPAADREAQTLSPLRRIYKGLIRANEA